MKGCKAKLDKRRIRSCQSKLRVIFERPLPVVISELGLCEKLKNAGIIRVGRPQFFSERERFFLLSRADIMGT